MVRLQRVRLTQTPHLGARNPIVGEVSVVEAEDGILGTFVDVGADTTLTTGIEENPIDRGVDRANHCGAIPYEMNATLIVVMNEGLTEGTRRGEGTIATKALQA